MKKILFLLLTFCASAFQLVAQTPTYDGGFLKEGNNTYTFNGGSGTQGVYYVYVAPNSNDVLLQLSNATSGTNFSASYDGTSATRINTISAESGKITYIPVTRGTAIVLTATAYSPDVISFTATMTNIDISAGSNCNNAIEATTSAPIFIPSKGSESEDLTYFEFIAQKTGTLKITYTSSIYPFTVQEGCTGTPTRLMASQADYFMYQVSTEVVAGRTYIFAGHAYSDVVATAEVEATTQGITCENPFIAQATNNTLPAAAGTYYYKYIPARESYLVVESDVMLPDSGSVSILNSCSDRNVVTEYNYLGIRQTVPAAQPVILCVEKNISTTGNQTFSVRIEDVQEGDLFSLPRTIEAGTYTTAKYDGTTYYRIQAPATGKYFIQFALNATPKDARTGVALYKEGDQTRPLAQGTTTLRHEMQAGEAYILQLTQYEGYNALSFTLGIPGVAQGEAAEVPLPAQQGNNAVTAGIDVRYYSYTMQQKAWLVLTPAAESTTIKILDPASQKELLYGMEGNKVKTTLDAGRSVIIKLSGLNGATSFTLAEETLKEGETCDLALPITAEETAVPATIGEHWYSYQATEDGILHISSDMPYEYSSTWGQRSDVYYRYGGCEGDSVSTRVGNGSTNWYSMPLPILKGDIVLFCVKTVTAVENATLRVEWTEAAPGQVSSKAIPLEPGDNTITSAATAHIPMWYMIQCNGGEFSLSTYNAAGLFVGNLYAASNLSKVLTSSYYVDNPAIHDGTYVLSFSGAAGLYYVCMTYSTAGSVLKLNGAAEPVGVQTLVAPEAQEGAWYDLSGRRVQRPAHGVYIRDGKKYLLK